MLAVAMQGITLSSCSWHLSASKAIFEIYSFIKWADIQEIYPHAIDLQHRNVEDDLFLFFGGFFSLFDPVFQHTKKLEVIMIHTATFSM